MKKIMISMLLVAALLAVFNSSALQSAAYAGSGKPNVVRLDGRFTDDFGSVGKFQYIERTSGNRVDHKFDLKINGAPPHTTLDMYVNDWWVGAVTTNGQGQVRLRMQFSVRGHWEPVPGVFPTLQHGDVITVGTATAVMQPK